MPATAIVGAQWGDEGKGKITDILAAKADAVVRAQGGANAGHTVVVGSQKFKMHLLPSGVLHEGCLAVVGPGCVVDPDQFIDEVGQLRRLQALKARLVVSDRAHLVLPHHRLLDEATEKSSSAVGSTKRGIGPAYAGKAARANLRVGDIVGGATPAAALERVERGLGAWIAGLGESAPPRAQTEKDLARWSEALEPFVDDSTALLHECLDEEGRIVLEGAQAILLDIDHGTYPYVTSSSPSTAGLCAGSGVPPSEVDAVVGVAKAYSTRVGLGPFPTELSGPVADHLVERGAEFGTTTGRRRRVGWLDLVGLRYAARINGFTHLAAMKLDVLDGLAEVDVCVAYEIDGSQSTRFPARADVLDGAKPVLDRVEGSFQGVAMARSWDHLPRGARALLEKMEEAARCDVLLASVGPGRDQTLRRGELP